MTKKSILRPLCGAALVAAAALFAGCSDVYTGGDADSTTVSFAGAEAQYTDEITDGSLKYSASVSLYRDEIDQAATDSTVTLTFYAQTRLDEESIEAAVAFYTLEDNNIGTKTAPIYAYPKRSAVPLPSHLLVYGESVGVTGTARFSVDTSTVTNGKIAVMVDATKLKDKRGNFVLNDDGNETAGEASDSWIWYIRVYNDKNGDYITSDKQLQPYSYYERFAPQYTDWDDLEKLKVFSDRDYENGKLTLRISAPRNDYILDTKSHYREDLAATLKKIYSVQVKAAGETSWGAEQPLTFEYKSDRKQYVTTTPQIPVGAKFRIVIKTITKDALPADTNAEKLYGHAAYASYKKNSYTDYYDFGYGVDYGYFPYYFTTEPSYIVHKATESDKFAAGNYSYEDITSAQRSFFDEWERIGKNKWLVSLEEEIEYGSSNDGDKPLYVYPRFDKIDGFKVVLNKNSGESYTELNATITEINKRTVLIELPSYYNPSEAGGTIELWVDSGTTITGNTLHPTQKTFGSFADVSKGVVSGYVKITDLPTSGPSGSIGSNDSPDVGVGGGSGNTGGGSKDEDEGQEPSNDVYLANTTWRYFDGEVAVTIRFYDYGECSVTITTSYGDDSTPFSYEGTYSVLGTTVYLSYNDEKLHGDVSGNSMTLSSYDGEGPYTFTKDY